MTCLPGFTVIGQYSMFQQQTFLPARWVCALPSPGTCSGGWKSWGSWQTQRVQRHAGSAMKQQYICSRGCPHPHATTRWAGMQRNSEVQWGAGQGGSGATQGAGVGTGFTSRNPHGLLKRVLPSVPTWCPSQGSSGDSSCPSNSPTYSASVAGATMYQALGMYH